MKTTKQLISSIEADIKRLQSKKAYYIQTLYGNEPVFNQAIERLYASLKCLRSGL